MAGGGVGLARPLNSIEGSESGSGKTAGRPLVQRDIEDLPHPISHQFWPQISARSHEDQRAPVSLQDMSRLCLFRFELPELPHVDFPHKQLSLYNPHRSRCLCAPSLHSSLSRASHSSSLFPTSPLFTGYPTAYGIISPASPTIIISLPGGMPLARHKCTLFLRRVTCSSLPSPEPTTRCPHRLTRPPVLSHVPRRIHLFELTEPTNGHACKTSLPDQGQP